jgi:uncharacterized membrane protein YkoI
LTHRSCYAKKLALEDAMRHGIILLLLAVSVTPALADASASHSASSNDTVHLDDRRDIARRAPVMPVADAVALAVKRVPGTVLATAIETNDGIRTWQIDILAEKGGKVRLWLNAANGEILKMAQR